MPFIRSVLSSAFLLLCVVRLDAQILLPVKELTAGGSHTCALLNDGKAKCWGAGSDGQLGNGNPKSIGDDPNEMGDNLTAIDLGTTLWTTCQAGEKVTVNGTATADRQCGACVSSYNNGTNLQSCTPWTTCQAGEKVITNGTATSDRQCGSCGANTFTSTTNQLSCTPWTVCKSTEVVSKEGTSTTDRECTEKIVVASGANSAAISAIVICSLIVGSALLGAFIYFYYHLKPAQMTTKQKESKEIQMAKV